MINTDRIIEFREKVNNSLLFKNYLIKHAPERRPWNVLCSAMDWIEVSATWFQQYTPRTSKDPCLASMEFSFYIVAVDTILKGMEQIEFVFSAIEKELGISVDRCSVRQAQDGVFSSLNGDENNVQHFNNIRAIFSAHSSYLELPRGFLTGGDESDKVKCCASWSIQGCGCETVYLYRKREAGPMVRFTVSREEIQKFAEMLYDKLSCYTMAIDTVEAKLTEKFKSERIDRNCSEMDLLNLLVEENQKRLGCDYYNYLLTKICVITSSTCTEPAVLKLKEIAMKLMQEIADAIQNAEYREFENDLSTRQSLPYSASKAFGALEGLVLGESDGCDFQIFGSSLMNEIKDTVKIPEYTDYKDLYVLILAALVEG